MRKILFGVIITLVTLFSFKYCDDISENKAQLQESTLLIQEHIQHVGKLVVTEGYFSEVFNYKNSKTLFGDYFTSQKKALVVVNAEVTIAYDLSKIIFELDDANKVLKIISIPEEEVKIHPELEYYDVQADYLNPFEAEDYNEINTIVKRSLQKKIDNSEIRQQAKNRLISELSKFYILTNSLGWTLQYQDQTISKKYSLEQLKL